MIRRAAALLCLLSSSGCVSDSLGAPAEPEPGCTTPDDCNGAICRPDGSCQTAGCGNHEPDPGEECDAGANNGTAGEPCTDRCVRRHCGDGTVDEDLGELCEGEGCRPGCTARIRCGDGLLDPGEQCDDGNDVAGDGCEDDCRCSGPTEIDAVWKTVLALRGDGAVFAWGFLPDAAPGGTATEFAVRLELPPALELAAGERLAAVLDEQGRLLVLDGENDAGGFDGVPATLRPLVLDGPYVEIAAGLDHLVLRDADGHVSALGGNWEGEAGVGRNGVPLPAPEPVTLEAPALEIAAGKHLSLAVLTNGTVWAWGASLTAQTGTQADRVDQPRKVSDLLSGCDRVRTSGLTSFARCGGAWWGWGWDAYGQLETATGVPPEICADGSLCRPVPARVVLPAGVPLAELAVGQGAVYGLDDEGAVWGWGNGPPAGGEWDVLGLGGVDEVVRTPTRLPLPLPGRYSSVAGGFWIGLALHESGALFTAGDNDGGALGRPPEVNGGLGWGEAARLCNPP